MTNVALSPRRRKARVLVFGVFVVGLAELFLHVYHKKKSPNPEDWAQLVEPVRQEKQDGDVVVVAPAWAEPWARKTLGDGVFPMRDVARSDMSRYASALEIGVLGQTSPESAGFREVSQRKVGPFVLRRLENPVHSPVTIDFVDRIAIGQADVQTTDPEARCLFNKTARVIAGGLGGHPTFPVARFECPGSEFFNVSETVIADQDFRPRRCIWAHPQAKGEVVIRFTDVRLGSVIRGHGGLYWIIERDKPGAPVFVNVRVNHEDLGRYEHKDGDGWSAFEMPLGAQANATNAVVEFRISTPNYMHRHFCFEAHSQ